MRNDLKGDTLAGASLTVLPALSARFQAEICNQPQEQEGRLKEGSGMLKGSAARYETFYM